MINQKEHARSFFRAERREALRCFVLRWTFFLRALFRKALGMPLMVYVAHPLGADPELRELNRKMAGAWLSWVSENLIGVASWITISGYWSEELGRARGLELDKQQIERCDELYICGPGQISAGMSIEIRHAKKCGLKVVDVRCTLDFDREGNRIR